MTTSFRKRLATFFVALYAFCVVAPHAAMALVHAGNVIHCFTEAASAGHAHTPQTHVHDNDAAHHHDDASTPDEQGTQSPCCGLFAVPGLAADSREATPSRRLGEKIASAPDRPLADHPPGRLIRPPIA